MTAFTVFGAVAVTACLAAVLRQARAEQAMMLTLAAGTVLLGAALSEALPAFSRIQALLRTSALSSEYSLLLFKALGICLLTQTASDVCRDAGESALASKAELVGKVLLLVCGLPLFEYAAQMLTTLIGGEGAGI